MDAITGMLNAVIPTAAAKIVIIAIALNTLLKGVHDAYDNTPENKNKVMWTIEFLQLLSGYLFLGKRPDIEARAKKDDTAPKQ